jgi:hypothetical protein
VLAASSGEPGWLSNAGALAVPGVESSIGGGPLATALFCLGIPEFQAKRYEGKVKGGNALVAVHTKDAEELTRARAALERAGAEDISISGEIAVPNGTPERSAADGSEGRSQDSSAQPCAEENS